jgi:LysM repeat protein
VDLNRSYKDYPTIIKDSGLNGYPKPDKKKTVKGDVNGDGKIDVTDVSKLTAHVKGVKPLTDSEKKAADINNDGKIDVADVSKLSNVVKGGSSSDTPKKEEWITHTVVSGDTLWSISQKYGVSVVRLAANNNIKNVNLIYPGQVLKIKTK